MQPADTPRQPELDRKGKVCRRRDSTPSRKHLDDTPGERIPKETSQVPFDIALSLLRPDEVEKLRRYVLAYITKHPRF
jgi:hypothetical protein